MGLFPKVRGPVRWIVQMTSVSLAAQVSTMPLAIYLGFEIDLEIALTLSVILVIISFLVLILVKGLLRREWP